MSLLRIIRRIVRIVFGERVERRLRRITGRELSDRVAIAEHELKVLSKRLTTTEHSLRTAQFLLAATGVQNDRLIDIAESARSQLGQDLFALHSADYREGGFFVEFGAGDGVGLSNTFLLESRFGWRGILAEPLPTYRDRILASRTAALDHRIVWHRTGEILEFIAAGYLSTIGEFLQHDEHAARRVGRETLLIETVSLLDLLREHDAPRDIDFLSIDTEGSEFQILSGFPFNDEYRIRAIACEHNFTEDRERVLQLLRQHGYRRVGALMSRHDDWFVLDDAESRLQWPLRGQ